MRYDYGLYLIALACFVLAGFLSMGYVGYIQLTTGNEAMNLVIAMFSAILGIVFLGIGYGVRPKKVVSTQPFLLGPSVTSKPPQTESEKKSRKKAVRKRRRSKKKT